MVEQMLNEEELINHWKWFSHIKESEIRIINKDIPSDVQSFFIHNEQELLEVCRKYFKQYHIYIGVNERDKKQGGTKIDDISFINNLVIDVDVNEIKDTAEAIRVGKKIASDFIKKDFHTPLTICSGRGMQLFFAIKPTENSEENRNRLKLFGQQLKSQYDTEIVKIDPAVFEPARIMRLAGTWNNKPKVNKQVFIINKDGVIRYIDENLTSYFLGQQINQTTSTSCPTSGIDILKFLEKDKTAKDLFEGNVILEKYPDSFPIDKRIDTTELLKFSDRSAAEQSLVCRLIYNGADKQTVYAIMEQSKIGKWKTKDPKYKELTYSAAAKIVTQSKIDMPKEISPHKFNFVEDERVESWDSAKKLIMKHYKENKQMCFFIHNKDTLVGKPLQFYNTIQRIRLCEKTEQTDRDTELIQTRIRFIGEGYDRRREVPVESLYLNLWVYRITENGREFIVLSEDELNEEECLIEGMIIELADEAEISKKLKLQKLTPTMFVQKASPTVEVLEPKKLVEFCKNLGWDEVAFKKILLLHESGVIFHHSPDFETLLSVFMLSGKKDGYPLHLLIMGPPGSGKTTLEEAINFKFREGGGIFEAGNSTIKGLIPSFKENPASPGYILKCSRFALIDEMMKCLDNARTVYKDLFQAQFGQLNMLLEQKRRMIGSGSGNNFIAHSTAKIMFASNPLIGKNTIFHHALDLDRTTLSRMLIWCQDGEHLNSVFNRKSEKSDSLRVYTLKGDKNGTFSSNSVLENLKNVKFRTLRRNKNKNIESIYLLKNQIDEKIDRYSLYDFIFPFLTVYDSCQHFTCNISDEKIHEIVKKLLPTIKEPMKSVLQARADHHLYLLIDGLVKLRCLFKDYDSTFTVLEKDYENAEKLLIHIIKTWDTDYSAIDEINVLVVEQQITL
jgi:hypothetical protein